MSHLFGDLLSQHLHRKYGLSQSKLAAGIQQDPSIIGKMCKGKRLNGPQARERVLAIIGWLREWGALEIVAEANALLEAAGMAPLRTGEPVEAALLRDLRIPLVPMPSRAPLPKLIKSHQSIVVAREDELAQLKNYLDLSRFRQGQVVFVTGEAGCGKTALVQEFVWRALKQYDDLIVTGGNCKAYTGLGDPYLPFREILGVLANNLETGWAAETFIQAYAQRLQTLIPQLVRALVQAGPDLLDTFVSAPALLTLATTMSSAGADWLTDLEKLVTRKASEQGQSGLYHSNLFEQYIRVLQTLARHQPLLLILDDLQWADEGSINLLFHLGRQLKNHRILMVGLYRTTDLSFGRDGKRHPLESVVNELQGHFGEVRIDLSSSTDKQFVRALLNTESNRLDDHFCDALYQHTSGHALFTIETLRSMQERGDLVKDEEGQWVQGTSLNWEILPARIEGVIGERISRLAPDLQGTLKVASVEGESFLGEVAAQVQTVDEWTMIQRLSGAIGAQHRLVRSVGSQRLRTQRLSHYRFHHILFQRYLYNNLDEAEKGLLHERVGEALERLYGEQVEDIAVQLAWHFREAGLEIKAIEYLTQAGKKALRLCANEEAIVHFTAALTLLVNLPDTPKRSQQEIDLLISLGPALMAAKGYAVAEVEQTYLRAEALCRQLGETPQLVHVLLGLWVYHFVRAELHKANELGQRLLRLPQSTTDSIVLLQAHRTLGNTLCTMGKFTLARQHFDQGIKIYTSQYHSTRDALLYNHDAGVTCLSYSSLALWFLGYPDQALERSRQALDLADQLEHPFNLAFAFSIASILQHLCRAIDQTKVWAEAALQLATEKGFAQWQIYGLLLQGWAQTQHKRTEEKIPQMLQALEQWQTKGAKLATPYFFLLVAEAYGVMGQTQHGIVLLDEALTQAHASGDRWSEAALYRLKGELLWQGGGPAGKVEGYFQQAIEVARQQDAKSLELRAAMSLSRLWREQKKQEEARQMLREVYDWFTEGFDTEDLKEAKKLLKE